MGLPQHLTQGVSVDDTAVVVPFPAKSKQAAAEINGVFTEATSMSFSDKLMITITQEGRLAQWVTVPLLSDNPTDSDPYFSTTRNEEDSLLPTVRFQARTILGAGSSERETMGQLYAAQLASMITTQNPEEQRALLLGLGLAKVDTDRELFLQIIELALKVI